MSKNVRGEKPKQEEKIRGEWFKVTYNPEQAEIKIEIKAQKIIEHFKGIREQYGSDINNSSPGSTRRSVIGQYGNAVSSAKRNIIRE